MIPGQGTPLTIEQSQKGEKTCLMVFDCRGYEPVEFSFGAGWKAESVSIFFFTRNIDDFFNVQTNLLISNEQLILSR